VGLTARWCGWEALGTLRNVPESPLNPLETAESGRCRDLRCFPLSSFLLARYPRELPERTCLQTRACAPQRWLWCFWGLAYYIHLVLSGLP
jgi:hypothetical protein